MIEDELSTHHDSASETSGVAVRLDTDYMKEFVTTFEDKLEDRKKKREKKKAKENLGKFIDE